jgi:RNA polymerase sigma factor (sigma-70 family)
MTPEEFQIALRALTQSNYLERVASGMHPVADPKDIAQDVLCTLWSKPPEDYTHVQDLKRYAAKAIRNRCIELALRKQGAPPFVELDEAGQDHLAQPLDPSASLRNPHDIYEQEQFQRLLREAMDILKPLERAVARLTHLNGESGPKIAQRLQLSLDVVRGARERAWMKMNKFFSDLAQNERGERTRDED